MKDSTNPDLGDVEITFEDADEVVVVDDTPDRDRGRKPLDQEVEDPTDAEMSAYSEGVQSRIKKLTHARHDERRAREATEREKLELERVAQALLNENQQLKHRFNAGAQEFAKVSLSAAEKDVDSARKRLKEAHESYDTDAIIAAQEELTDAKAQLMRARDFRPPAVQDPEDVVQISKSAPQQTQLDDKVLLWQGRNQWFGAPGKEDMTSFSLGLHQKLVNSGVDPRSDEYFESIDSRLREVFPDFFSDGVRRSEPAQPRKPATVVASGAQRSSGSRKIQLTTTQVTLAKRLGLTPQQYAVEVLKLEK